MDLSHLLPPSDLLDKVRGIESGLRQRKRLSAVGAFGATISIFISAVYVIALLPEKLDAIRTLAGQAIPFWPLLLLAFFIVFFSLLFTWSTFWLRESRQPFRYTCSIGAFESVCEAPKGGMAKCMTWMPHDITNLLNERVQRFFFADQAKAPDANAGDEQKDADRNAQADASSGEPYIHIRGHWVVREREEGHGLEIEVMPRVRLGSTTSPEVLAKSIVFPLLDEDLRRNEYAQLLEQVYHSVVTEVYRQLKEDVRRKIALLPTVRFRAIALLYEADDYARSNSLDAYEEAAELYRRAAAMVDPLWLEAPRTKIPRAFWRIGTRIYSWRARLRRFEAHYRPSVQELDLIGARAMSGNARMLTFRLALSTLVGQTMRAAFEARPMTGKAIERIESLSEDVPGYRDALFDARVTQALTLGQLGDSPNGARSLRAAAGLDPRRAAEDPVYIYARGLLAPDRRTRLSLLRRCVERAPRFEVGQHELASQTEKLWRLHDSFETRTAYLVLDEYRKLLQINPGNLAGWSNTGYVHWLLGDAEKARLAFEQGKRFKSIKKDIFVSELDYGLARIYAEDGKFEKAYEHYVFAVSVLSLGAQGGDYRPYYFDSMSDALQKRFMAYRRAVLKHVFRQYRAAVKPDPEMKRISNSIRAFVLNDTGEAYLYAAGYPVPRMEEKRRVRRGVGALKRAIRRNPNFVLPYVTLGGMLSEWLDRDPLHYLKKARELQPSWHDTLVSILSHYAFNPPEVAGTADAASAARLARDVLEQRLADDSLSSADRERLTIALAAKSEDVRNREEAAREALSRREEYAESTRALMRTLLPQDWLWKDGQLNLETLNDPLLNSQWKWERDFTYQHANALWAWSVWSRQVLQTASVETSTALVEHVRAHFWPADPIIVGFLLQLKLDKANYDAPRRKSLLLDAVAMSPTLAFDQPEANDAFTPREWARLHEEAISANPDDAHTVKVRERLAVIYHDAAAEELNARAALEWLRKAADTIKDAWPCAELSRALETLASAERDVSLLQQAIDEAEEARRRAPEEGKHARRIARLQTLQTMSERFGSAAFAMCAPEPPLVVEYSRDLKPVFESAPVSVSALSRAAMLEDLHRGLLDRVGVSFPPIVFRAMPDETSRRRYTIRVRGEAVAEGELRKDWWFEALASTFHAIGVPAEYAEHPISGKSACWVPVPYDNRARDYSNDNSIDWRSPFRYMIDRIESVLLGRGSQFLRVDDVVRLMDGAGLSPEVTALIVDRLLLDFANVVRALAHEGVWVHQPAPILRAFRNAYAPGRALTAVVEEMLNDSGVRKRNAAFRNAANVAVFRVTAAFEAAVRNGLAAGKSSLLALAPMDATRLRDGVRDALAAGRSGDEHAIVLVASDLRPYVSTLLEARDARLHVLSDAQLFPGGLTNVRATIDLAPDAAGSVP